MKNAILFRSVAEPEPPLEEWSRSRFFCWLGPRAGAAFFEAAPALTESFWQAKKESLVVVTKRDLKAIYIMVNVIRKRLALKIHFLRAQNDTLTVKCMEPEPPFFCLEPEQTRFGRSRSRAVGSRNSDFRSRSRPKKWRLQNTPFQ